MFKLKGEVTENDLMKIQHSNPQQTTTIHNDPPKSPQQCIMAYND